MDVVDFPITKFCRALNKINLSQNRLKKKDLSRIIYRQMNGELDNLCVGQYGFLVKLIYESVQRKKQNKSFYQNLKEIAKKNKVSLQTIEKKTFRGVEKYIQIEL